MQKTLQGNRFPCSENVHRGKLQPFVTTCRNKNEAKEKLKECMFWKREDSICLMFLSNFVSETTPIASFIHKPSNVIDDGY